MNMPNSDNDRVQSQRSLLLYGSSTKVSNDQKHTSSSLILYTIIKVANFWQLNSRSCAINLASMGR